MVYSVILKNGSTGTINSNTINGQHASDFIGETMTVQSHDENGMTIEHTEIMVDVLEEKNDWE
jgi:hypothetical protein